MDIEAIRLACYGEVVKARRTMPSIGKKEVPEIAEVFAEFCGDSELRLTALKMGIEEADRRTTLADVVAISLKLVEFSRKPKPAPASRNSGRGKGRSR